MTANAATFGAQADAYAAARPTYPDALFGWLAKEAPGHGAVWDVGTGSGQAAQALAERFEQVHATDIDDAQLAAAPPHPRITYAVRPAELSGLDERSIDAVTVATALHWFDLPRFWTEVARVGRRDALFAAWTYHRIDAPGDVQSELIGPVLRLIDPYWSDGNRLSWRGYPPGELGFPFTPIDTPPFACNLSWTPARLAAFMRSWSAHLRARQDGLAEALAATEAAGLSRLGEAERDVRLPLAVIAGRIG